MDKHATPPSTAAQTDIRLSCADFTFPLLSHDRSLDLIRDLGFAGVDIGFFEGRGHINPSTALLAPSVEASSLRSRCEDRGLRIADLFLIPGSDFTVLAANHPDAGERQKSRDLFERSLEFAVACAAEHFSILPGILCEGEERAISFARAVEELSWRADLAVKAGLPLSFEAHMGSLVTSPTEVLALLEAVPTLGLILDCGHFIVPGYSMEEIETLIPRTVHMHARGACKDRIQVVAGENEIDFPHIVRALKHEGYNGWICSEYVWMQKWGCDRVDNLSETILLREVLLEAISSSKE